MPSPVVPAPEFATTPLPASVAAVPGAPAGQAALIDAYWDDVEERVLYLLPLLGAGRHNESLTLCATYLEAVAHAIVTLGEVDGRFADELEQREADPYLTLVHPLQLTRVAMSTSGMSKAGLAALGAVFAGPEYTLLYQDQALSVVRATLPPTDAALIERVIWRGTIAYVIYDFIRTQSFRRREGARTVGLGGAFHEGETTLGLNIPELVALLQSMVGEARARSHARGRLPDWG